MSRGQIAAELAAKAIKTDGLKAALGTETAPDAPPQPEPAAAGMERPGAETELQAPDTASSSTAAALRDIEVLDENTVEDVGTIAVL